MANFLNNLFGASAQQTLSGQYSTATQNHLANQYSQNLGQSMMNAKQGVVQGIMASQQAIKPFNPNEIEAYKIPLSQLVTLWQAKFGDEWVEIFDEDFWRDAGVRLDSNGKLESARGGWFRIKEDV
jgi:hypothetical protein